MDAEQVVRTYSDMVYGIAYRYAKNKEDAEDIYSETFLTYFKKERDFNDEEHRKAWLIKVTINNAKTLLSKKRFDEDIDAVVDVSNPKREAGKAQLMDLRNAIEKLKPEYRETIMLFYVNDMSVRSIAETLGVTENTVKLRLSRGRAKLREELGGGYGN